MALVPPYGGAISGEKLLSGLMIKTDWKGDAHD
ncbi:hypothetical protein QE380_001107 [Acinetobacter baylyi]|uniref:Uncharacterized protein n=1 Tax=Acinetobacter baylyi TaxID=202950 RepID=A0ABU0UUF9_ACIBI|nr:hypothetical protein F952_00081 [Acinetobacter baylyi DSM 14961 = CIP 107474]MDQ1208184.1 hypothetical protein [Acinetobacter baylyi]MDR6104743.1 hypothetical protein [Acinetobacter baylyi]MDR6185056.1 hypothetical protein [Acinetobacter baylyi]